MLSENEKLNRKLLDAVIWGHIDNLRSLLLDRNIDINGIGVYKALKSAVRHGHKEIVNLIIEAADEISLLKHAMENGNRSTIKVLLEHGTKVDRNIIPQLYNCATGVIIQLKEHFEEKEELSSDEQNIYKILCNLHKNTFKKQLLLL